MKRGFIFVMLFVISLGIISAANCYLNDEATCPAGEYKILGLYDQTNAHAQVSGSYPYSLCCNWGSGSTACDGSNTVLWLSDTTNAHANGPDDQGSYPVEVCYEDVRCTLRTTLCDASIEEMEFLSLSSVTNAHVGKAGAYPNNKVCCNGSFTPTPPPSPTPEAYWSDSETAGSQIGKIYVEPEVTRVWLRATGLAPSTSVNFDINEDDGFIGDDFVLTLPATTDGTGSIAVSWVITQSDLDKCDDAGFDTDNFVFYFDVESETSNNLNITVLDEVIEKCSAYTEEDLCNDDPYDIAEYSVEHFLFADTDESYCGSKLGDDSAGCDIYAGCECEWSGSSCNASFYSRKDLSSCPGGGGATPEYTGECITSESEDPNACEDGVLEVTWIGTWEWDPANSGVPDIGGTCSDPDFTYDLDFDLCYYDPTAISEQCRDGASNSIECPSMVELPFFTLGMSIATLVVIAIIYYVLHNKNCSSCRKKTVKH